MPTPVATPPCRIEEDNFIASHPSDFYLLWQIELYLRPRLPGTYPLTRRALHFHSGDPFKLIELLEAGLKSNLPEHTQALILKQPSIRVTEGIMLEFSSPAEMAQLRRQPALRKYIQEFLSPQRVLVSTKNAKMLFGLLKRRGVYVHRNEDQTPAGKEARRTHFHQKMLLQPAGKSQSKLIVIEKYKQLGQVLDVLYRVPGCAVEQRRITPYAS